MLMRAFMAPMAATVRTRPSSSWRVSRLSSQIRAFRLSISVFSLVLLISLFCSHSLCVVAISPVPALIYLYGDWQSCIKTGLIPVGHLQGIALFYPAYATGIHQLQTDGTVQMDNVSRFPECVMVITELQLHHVTGVRQFEGQLHVRGGQVRPVRRGIPALLQHPLYIPCRHRSRTFRIEGGQHNQHPPLRQRRTGCHNVSPLS